MPIRAPLLQTGHQLRLLKGSGELFAAMVACIDAAQDQVSLETYIFDFTGSGAEIAHALERAARRGVQVQVVADGFGTPATPPAWLARFADAGVQYRVYSPLGQLGLLWPGSWRRLHRKLCVVDGVQGFCGGINILDDLHDPNHGALAAPRFDFAVQVSGPLIAQMNTTLAQVWQQLQPAGKSRATTFTGALVSLRAAMAQTQPAALSGPAAMPGQQARAALVLRDNLRNRARIERAYRRAIGRAHGEIIIANAYFVPGRKMRQALINAARRGVTVRLLLQGRYEYFMQYYAARPIYGALLRAGIEIHEYSPSFLHAKVAVIDGRWATVGSSNLDPLSLLLAREANVMVEDASFAGQLRERLLHAMAHDGHAMAHDLFERRPLRQRAMERVALLVMRVLLAVQGKKYL